MQTIFSLLNGLPYIEFPMNWPGWVGGILLTLLLGWGIWRWWEAPDMKAIWKWLAFWALIFIVPLTNLFIGMRISTENVLLPVPGAPLEARYPVAMIFSAFPWVLAAGLLGTVPAVILAFFSGVLRSFWETHTLYTILSNVGLALLFSVAIRQRYRTLIYRMLRRPLGAALVLSVAFIPFYVCIAFLDAGGSLAARLDFSLALAKSLVISRGFELLIAGFAGEAIFLLWPNIWGVNTSLLPSPAERNLQLRFFYQMAPLILLLLLTLMVSDWVVAGNAARKMVKDRLVSTAKVAAESLPYFLETGQNLIITLANDELLQIPPDKVTDELALKLRSVPYFRLLYLFDEDGKPINGYPFHDFTQLQIKPEEEAGIQLALKGVPVQTYVLPAWAGETTAQIAFIAAIYTPDNGVGGVILGRTDLRSNPFTQPAIVALNTVAETGGEGAILDEKRRILYHSIPELVMTDYLGALPIGPELIDDISSMGTRQLVYYQPVTGRPWSIVLSVPAEQVQQLALDIAIPLLVLLVFVSAVIAILLRIGLRTVTSSLKLLAQEATLISRGQLDHPLHTQGEDEIGQFGKAFETMRLSLKARLDEINKLLHVSQGVASNLQVEEAIKPILQAAMIEDACMARAVMVQEVTLEISSNLLASFGTGPSAHLYAHLDRQLFDLSHQHAIFSIPNLARTRRLTIDPALSNPSSLIALPIHHDNTYYGTLWIAFNRPRNFTEEEVRFLGTLAGQAAIAATNAKLYATAEIGRQRLEAVLSSTPEPVLVIDDHSMLLLLNPAALQVPGLIIAAAPGIPVKDAISNPQLLDLILTNMDERLSTREITLSNRRIYFASVSPVVAEGHSVGKICMLRDITHYKELDTLKSDFVSTVSHDLRSPLTLMRGYATMMQMVGDLNDQQKVYVEKIVTGVGNMSRLVTNLLDLGRIEAGIGLQIERVSAKGIIDEVLGSLQPQITQKGIQIKQYQVSEIQALQTLFIEADRALLQQALYNLVDNAVKYTKVGGEVEIHLLQRRDHMIFEIRDKGIGIAPLDLPRLFEKFYRSGRRESYVERGTGLGLAIVKSIIERHGGRVWVESQLGKGSTFYVEIPTRQSENQQPPINL